MKPAFLEIDPEGPRVPVRFAGEMLMMPEGANLAAALLAAGVTVLRHTPVSGAPRAPYCMMGACFDCLIEVERTVRQACMMEVTEGLEIARPHEGGHA
ncbi:2Fe-2S iron-sulfur cluster-binding protein [Roseovarius sp. MBR-154]